MIPALFPTLAIVLTTCAGSCAAGTLGNVADTVAVGVSAAALGTSFYRDDVEGQRQWLVNTTATVVTVELMKRAFAHTDWGTRPNGRPYAFPSGHTALACSGAAFLTDRYGIEPGAPAFGLAAVVAYVRVREGEHRWRDTLAGCAVAALLSRQWVTPYGAITVAASFDRGTAAVDLAAHF